MSNRSSIIWKVSKEELEYMVHQANSFSDILTKLGLTTRGSTYKILKKRLSQDQIDTSLLKEKVKANRISTLIKNANKSKYSLDTILVNDSDYKQTTKLKKRLIKNGLLEEKCAKCGNKGEWLREKLELQLDHIDGNSSNNELTNLRLLCPNCHSQTETFSGKNSKGKETKICKNPNCNNPLCRENKSGYCQKCFNSFIHKNEQKRFSHKQCKDCGTFLSQSKTGFCVSCHNKRNNKSIKLRKVSRPNRKELIFLILNKSFLEIGRQFNVSDNAIRKWCKAESLPYKKEDLKANKEFLLKELK